MTKESVQFHIRSSDYFGTLATILDLLRQDAARCGYTEKHAEVLQCLRDDLVYLQHHCRVVKKP